MTKKQLVINVVRQLPDEATLEEIAERVAVLAGLREDKQAADQGLVVPHDKLQLRIVKWALVAPPN